MELIELSEKQCLEVLKRNYHLLEKNDIEKLKSVGIDISFEKILEDEND